MHPPRVTTFKCFTFIIYQSKVITQLVSHVVHCLQVFHVLNPPNHTKNYCAPLPPPPCVCHFSLTTESPHMIYNSCIPCISSLSASHSKSNQPKSYLRSFHHDRKLFLYYHTYIYTMINVNSWKQEWVYWPRFTSPTGSVISWALYKRVSLEMVCRGLWS